VRVARPPRGRQRPPDDEERLGLPCLCQPAVCSQWPPSAARPSPGRPVRPGRITATKSHPAGPERALRSGSR
jgi:hypothetical protein